MDRSDVTDDVVLDRAAYAAQIRQRRLAAVHRRLTAGRIVVQSRSEETAVAPEEGHWGASAPGLPDDAAVAVVSEVDDQMEAELRQIAYRAARAATAGARPQSLLEFLR